MKRCISPSPCVLAALLTVVSVAAPARANLEDEAIRAGSKIISDPGTFLFDNFHEPTDNVTPLYMGRKYEVSTNFFPALLPLLEFNLSGKVQAHREHGYWPQIDVLFGGWSSLPMLFAPESDGDDVSPTLWGYHAGLVLAESLDPRMRVFFGYEYSQLRFGADLKDLKQEDVTDANGNVIGTQDDTDLDFLPDSISVGKAEHYLIIGTELLRTPEKRVFTQVGYGLGSNRFVARLMWQGRRWTTGFVFFPEGYPLILWPVATMQWRW